jgi:DNA-binding SARP family transcriptional activator
MEFRLLGPVQAFTADTPVELGDRKQRLVLAVLLLEANQLVPVGRLIRILWQDRPPATARRIVQTHISRLRSTLANLRNGAAEPDLTRCGEGYLLTCDPQLVDVHCFRSAVEQARLATDDMERVQILRQALELWHGPALADVATDAVREELCAGLDESRLTALEERLDAELRLGHQDRLIDDLTELSARYPFRQRLVGQLMLALHQAGRTADALRLYAGYRGRLVDELGLEPSAELQRLHVGILRAEPIAVAAPVIVAAPVAATAPAAAPVIAAVAPRADPAQVGAVTPPRPQQLPAQVARFVGRKRYLAKLGEALSPAAVTPPATPVVLVTGMAGVGKTALVTRWAHHCDAMFPDGQLYVDLRGHASAPPLSEAEALAALLSGLGVAAEQVPPRAEDAAALYRSLVADRRMLVVLDDAPGPDLVRALLPGSATCAVVVTSRDRLVGVVASNGATRIELEPLDTAEAVDLAVRTLGTVPHDPAAVRTLVKLCDRLPLAIRIAATRVADRGLDVASQVAAMSGPRLMDMLQIEGDEDAGVPAALDRSYATLPAAAARMFLRLSAAGAQSVPADAAARLAGTTVDAAQRALQQLVNANLVSERGTRFSLPDLVRHYAVTQLSHMDKREPRSDGSTP